MLIPTLLLEHFIVFACLSVFRWLFYCVLVPIRLLSIPRRTPLFTTLLVPSLLLGYWPTYSCTVWIASWWYALSISVLRFFVGDYSPSMYSRAQFINWALIFLNCVPCSGFVSTSAHINPAGHSTILTSSLSTLSLIKKNFAWMCLVFLELENFPLVSSICALTLSCCISGYFTQYPCAWKNYRDHKTSGIYASTDTSSVSVELLVFNFILRE